MTTLRLSQLPFAIHGTTVVLTVALAFTVAELSWRLVPGGDSVGDVVAPPVVSAPGAEQQGAGLLEVADMHLFGRSPLGAVAVTVPVEAPETRLNLTLRGVVASPEGRAMAIVADPRGNEKPYPTGATLPGGAVLVEIHPNRVILRRGGRYEALRLPREGGTDSATTVSVEPANPGGLAEFRQHILNNPGELSKIANVQPVLEAGALKGYRIEAGQNPALLRQAGLQPGDVVTRVNGIPLRDGARMGDVLKQLSSAGKLDVEVERGGRTERVAIDLNR